MAYDTSVDPNNNSINVQSGLTNQYVGAPQTGIYQISFLSSNMINDASMTASYYYLTGTAQLDIDTDADSSGIYTSQLWRASWAPSPSLVLQAQLNNHSRKT